MEGYSRWGEAAGIQQRSLRGPTEATVPERVLEGNRDTTGCQADSFRPFICVRVCVCVGGSTPMIDGSSQARDQVHVADGSLHPSCSNARSLT